MKVEVNTQDIISLLVRFKNFGLTYLISIVHLVINWIPVILSLVLNKNLIEIQLRDDRTKRLLTREQVLNLIVAKSLEKVLDSRLNVRNNSVEFFFKKKKLLFYGIMENGWVVNEFLNFEYKSLPFQNKAVLDIGANTGGTAIYLALAGAKKVFAFEPFPLTFRYLIKNVQTNKLSSCIQCLNFGIAGVDSLRLLPTNVSSLGARSMPYIHVRQGNKPQYQKIKFVDLSEFIRDNVEGEFVIKADCEGCEYDIDWVAVIKSNENLVAISMEYHNGSSTIIKQMESAGFLVVEGKNCEEGIGIITAVKKSIQFYNGGPNGDE
ncbi:FkbM family methyltransferase [Thermoplasmatales archaeon AK]|nr:FkbM family methyltransferase [Thermoplasmatales archaeon AK]